MSLEHIPDCLCGDWIRDDGVDVFHGLDSIGSLSSSDLCDDRALSIGRKLGRTTSRGDLSVRKEVLKYPGYSRLANTKL